MASKEDLEQELDIVEAELDAQKKQNYEQARELDLLRGQVEHISTQAKAAGVALAIPSTPGEAEKMALDQVRAGLNTDLQALDELRTPPPYDPLAKPESTLDMVRANQRERAELQVRVSRGNNIISRVAAALKIDKWDEEGSQIVEAVNNLAVLRLRVSRKIDELKKTAARSGIAIDRLDGKGPQMAPSDAGAVFWLSALEWVLASPTVAAVDPNKSRIINFVVNGRDTPVDAQPEHTLKHLLGLALVRADVTHKPVENWMLFAEDGGRLSFDRSARELGQSSKVVAILPSEASS